MEDGLRAALEAEKTDLARKLAIRTNRPGYTENVVAIQVRIDAIEEELNADG